MVVCNVDRYLAEAIESVLGQTFRDFEFIVVDFGSTDHTKATVSRYAASDSRVKFREIPPCGLAEARNAACSLAQGQYIAIMDADDVSLPERLAWEFDFMEAHPEVGVVGGAVECIDAAGRVLTTWSNPTENQMIQLALNEGCLLRQSTVLMRRDAFVALGGYRAPFAQAEDYDLWLRLAERYQLANLEQVVLRYRLHPSQISVSRQSQQSLCTLAAKVAATSRRNGLPDPLNFVVEITPALLAGLGTTRAMQQRQLASDLRDWVRNLCNAAEYSAALKTALEALQSDLEYVEKWRVADLQIAAAGLYWRQRRILRSGLSAAQAVLTYPLMVGRPLKPLLRRLGLA
jgi:cellulose synthase/poly-beta-1,6-N-acetylglucosamine synthase-like glycosyltransferase